MPIAPVCPLAVIFVIGLSSLEVPVVFSIPVALLATDIALITALVGAVISIPSPEFVCLLH